MSCHFSITTLEIEVPSPLLFHIKQRCISPSRSFGLDMQKIQWGIALFSDNIHLRGKSLNISFFALIIYYSEDSWNNTRFCLVGGWAPICEMHDAVQVALFSNNIVLREGRKICCFRLSLWTIITIKRLGTRIQTIIYQKGLLTCIG